MENNLDGPWIRLQGADAPFAQDVVISPQRKHGRGFDSSRAQNFQKDNEDVDLEYRAVSETVAPFRSVLRGARLAKQSRQANSARKSQGETHVVLWKIRNSEP
jgi:hypothetical protein